MALRSGSSVAVVCSGEIPAAVWRRQRFLTSWSGSRVGERRFGGIWRRRVVEMGRGGGLPAALAAAVVVFLRKTMTVAGPGPSGLGRLSLFFF